MCSDRSNSNIQRFLINCQAPTQLPTPCPCLHPLPPSHHEVIMKSKDEANNNFCCLSICLKLDLKRKEQFWALSGAQEVTIFVRSSVCPVLVCLQLLFFIFWHQILQDDFRMTSGHSQVSLRSLCAYFDRQTEPKILRLVFFNILLTDRNTFRSKLEISKYKIYNYIFKQCA